jgi:hypothetical protein
VRTLIGLPPLVPISLQQLASEFIARSYRERLKRAGEPECDLCGERRKPGQLQAGCKRCGYEPDEPVSWQNDQPEVNEVTRGTRY